MATLSVLMESQVPAGDSSSLVTHSASQHFPAGHLPDRSESAAEKQRNIR